MIFCICVVKFYGQTFAVVATSLAVVAMLLRLSNDRYVSQPPPLILKKVLTGPLASILCITGYTKKVS